MILREIYVKDNSVRRYDNPIVGLSRIGVSSTFDSEITYITNTEKMLSLFKSRDLFGCISVINDYHVQLVVLTPEELNLLDYIDSVTEIRGRFPSGINCIVSSVMLSNKYTHCIHWFFLQSRLTSSEYFAKFKYWSILQLLISSDFSFYGDGFYIRLDDSLIVHNASTVLYGAFYRVNCSESEFRKFLAKVAVLKK